MKYLKGIAISEGIGIGRVDIDRHLVPTDKPQQDPATEQRMFENSLSLSIEQLSKVRSMSVDQEQQDILDAHLVLIEDPELVDGISAKISTGLSASKAIEETAEAVAVMFEGLQDDYLKARASDIRDIKTRLIQNLVGEEHTVNPGSIYVTEELFPTKVPLLTGIEGVVSQKGGSVSHAAILVRAAGIPAVFGIEDIESVYSGKTVIVDGYAGEVVVDPDEKALDEYRRRVSFNHYLELKNAAANLCGEKLLVKANISSVDEASEAAAQGGDGIGVVRTEFLFNGRDTQPTEDEQYQAYSRIVQKAQGLPVVIRTLDAGSDKPLPFVPIQDEPNPALGLRGLRISLAQPELFKVQLRAILRAAEYGQVTVMYPMVTCAEEIVRANNLLDEARMELQQRGSEPAGVLVGAMVEVPAAALQSYDIAAHVDYLSIGSNDLTQYTLAADRTNSSVAYLYNEIDPSVLHLIRMTVEAGKARGIPVCVCGEMASRPAALVELLNVGIREISISVPYINRILAAVRE